MKLYALSMLGLLLACGTALAAEVDASAVWTTAKIGAAAPAAGAVAAACDRVPTSCPAFSITGSGTGDLRADAFTYLYQGLMGDGWIVAHVSDFEAGGAGALAGLTLRSSLAADAVQLSLFVSADGSMVYRRRARAATVARDKTPLVPDGSSWVKLARTGTAVTAYRSIDGTQWTIVGSMQVPVADEVFVGVSVTSADPSSVARAPVTEVRVGSDAALPDGWSVTDIGAAGRSAVATIQDGRFAVMHTAGVSGPTDDRYKYVYKRVSGDVGIVAHVSHIGGPAATGVAGLMVRGGLDGQAVHLQARFSPARQESTRFRPTAGGTAVERGAGTKPTIEWLRITRKGNVLQVDDSVDGLTWAPVSSRTLALPATFYVGVMAGGGQASVAAIGLFESVQIQGAPANLPPVVSMLTPRDGSTLPVGVPVTITASASDPDDRVEAVDFYLDGKLIGTDTATPYAAAWPYPTLGAHTVLAVARDTDGATATARSVVTAVEQAPPPPPGGTSWQVSFQPSIDHVALVDRYVLELYKTGGTRALAATKDLGWPPVVAGECVVDISAAVSRLPAGTYEAVLRAVDDATFTSSAATVVFTR